MPPGGRQAAARSTSMASAPRIIAERVEYLDENGKLVTESLRDFTKKALKKRFASLDDFLKRWKAAERKQAIIEELAAEGLPLDPLAEEVGKDLDPFDLICHVAFDRRRSPAASAPTTSRSATCSPSTARRPAPCSTRCSPSTRTKACSTSTTPNVLQIPPFDAMGTPVQLIKAVRRHGQASSAPSTNCKPPSIRKPPRSMSVRNTVKSIQDIMRQDVGVDGDAQRISQLCWMFFLKIIDDQDQELELLQDGLPLADPEETPVAHLGRRPRGHHRRGAARLRQRRAVPGAEGASRSRPSRATAAAWCADVFEDAYNYMKSGQLMRQVVNKINEVDFNNLAERQHFGDIYEQILNDLQSAGNAGEYYTPRAVTAFMVDRIDPQARRNPARSRLRHRRLPHLRHPPHARALREEARGRADACSRRLRAVEKKQLPHMLCVTNMLLHGIEDPSFVRHDNTLARPYISYTPVRPRGHRAHQSALRRARGRRHRDPTSPSTSSTRETADLFLALIIRLLKPGGRAAVVLPDGSLFGEGVKTRLKEHLMEECNLHTIVRLPNSVFKPYATIGTNLLFFEKGEPTKDIWFYEHRVPDGQKAYSMTKPIRVEHLQALRRLVGRREAQGPRGDARSPGRSRPTR